MAREEVPNLFTDVARVTRPGELFVASDSLSSDELAAFQDGDTHVPVDPEQLGGRLEQAEFADVEVRVNECGWAASARAGGA